MKYVKHPLGPLIALASLQLFLTFTLFSAELVGNDIDIPFFGSIIGIIISLVLHFEAKERPWLYFVCIFLNTAASAMFVSCFYLLNDIPLRLFETVEGHFDALCLLTFALLLWRIFKAPRKATLIASVALFVLLTSGCIVMWVIDGPAVRSFAIFSLIMALFYILAIAGDSPDRKSTSLAALSLASFGAIAIIAAVVVGLLTAGEELAGLEIFEGFKAQKKKEKRKKIKDSSNKRYDSF